MFSHLKPERYPRQSPACHIRITRHFQQIGWHTTLRQALPHKAKRVVTSTPKGDGMALIHVLPSTQNAQRRPYQLSCRASFCPLLFSNHLFGSTGGGHGPLGGAQPGPRSPDADDELAAVPRLHPGTRMLIADNLAPETGGGDLQRLRWSGCELLSARRIRHHIQPRPLPSGLYRSGCPRGT